MEILPIFNRISEGSGSVSEELEKTFSGLTFNWPLFVFSLIVLMLVTIIITFLVYKPIKKMVKRRQELIQKKYWCFN